MPSSDFGRCSGHGCMHLNTPQARMHWNAGLGSRSRNGATRRSRPCGRASTSVPLPLAWPMACASHANVGQSILGPSPNGLPLTEGDSIAYRG
jgi:hypothetical protein